MIENAIKDVVRSAVREELGDLPVYVREVQGSTRSGGRELLTVAETAELLRLSRNLTYQFIRQDRLPALRLGRRLLVPRWALDEWIGYETPEPLRTCRYCDRDAVARYLRRNDEEHTIAPVDLCKTDTCHERLLDDLRTAEAIT